MTMEEANIFEFSMLKYVFYQHYVIYGNVIID